MLCSVDNCEKRVFARSWCQMRSLQIARHATSERNAKGIPQAAV